MKELIYRINLVEDDLMSSNMYKEILERDKRIKVRTFEKGEIMFNSNHSNVDLYVLDYHLGEKDNMTGMDILNKIDDQVPAIILSGQMNMEIALDLIKSGACDYITKNDMALINLERSVKMVIKTIEINREIKQLKRKNKFNLMRVTTFTILLCGLVYLLI